MWAVLRVLDGARAVRGAVVRRGLLGERRAGQRCYAECGGGSRNGTQPSIEQWLLQRLAMRAFAQTDDNSAHCFSVYGPQ
jgi:hypothetical protein